MRVLAAGESESRLEVVFERGNSLDLLAEGRVNLLLEGLLLVTDGSLFNLFSGQEIFLSRFFGLGLGSLEESVSDASRIDAGEVDLGGGGNDKGLVDAAERNAIHAVRTSDEEEAGLELFEENNALSAVLAGDKNEDSAWRDGRAKAGRLVVCLTALEGLRDLVGGVPFAFAGVGELEADRSPRERA